MMRSAPPCACWRSLWWGPLAVILLGSILLGSGVARAEDDVAPPAWVFRGFGSLGMVHSNQRQADYTSSTLKGEGAGYSRSWSADVDSRLGAQVDWRISPQWSAVVQIVSEQNRVDSYVPAVEWANFKYEVTSDFSIRVGRFAIPALLYADYRKVGYALPWVRTPVEVYGTFGVSRSDGADLSYRWRSGAVKNVLQTFYGGTEIKITDTSNVPVRGLFILTDTVDYGAFTARASYLSSHLSIDLLKPLFDSFRQYGAQGNVLANQYEVHDKHSQSFSAGLSYDPGNWFAVAEIGHVATKSFVGVKTFMYASAGYRIASLTPYLSYAAVHADDATSVAGLSLSGLPAQAQAGAIALNGALNALLLAKPQQKTVTLGVRWDLLRNAALKVQYDRVMPQAGSPGTLVNVQPGFHSSTALSIFSTVLDFVY